MCVSLAESRVLRARLREPEGKTSPTFGRRKMCSSKPPPCACSKNMGVNMLMYEMGVALLYSVEEEMEKTPFFTSAFHFFFFATRAGSTRPATSRLA